MFKNHAYLLSLTIWVSSGVPILAGDFFADPVLVGPAIELGDWTSTSPQLNNDDPVGHANPNEIGWPGLSVTALDPPVDLLIRAENSGGTTEFRVDIGHGINETGVAVDEFHIELGVGSGASFQRLSVSPIPGVHGLDFDFPNPDPMVTSPTLPLVNHEADRIVFHGGVIEDGASMLVEGLSIDLPDTTIGSEYAFTVRLRGFAAVPEPNHGVLVLGTAIGLAIFRRR
ncbi:MAG: hypothetical protein AAGF97_10210 [Planctomycetota bacterium]